VDDLKIKIMDDMDKYNSIERISRKKPNAPPLMVVELNFGDSHCLEDSALIKLCDALLELYPNDAVKLEISFSVGNH